MPLVLKRRIFDGHPANAWDAYSGSARVAAIWDTSHHSSSPQPWNWTMRCAIDGTAVVPHGYAASYEDAKAAVAREWRKWVDAAGLEEKDDG